MNRTILLITSFLIGVVSAFAQAAFNAPGTGNPVIPGYFADPTIKKFGDTYYMYATTDGSGMDQQGLCKLDLDAHELARQSLDMGTRCDAAL